ncbi:MAG: hypothetical protein ACRELZ_14575, partial [Candidatus Rokuibacteriota bacterium]
MARLPRSSRSLVVALALALLSVPVIVAVQPTSGIGTAFAKGPGGGGGGGGSSGGSSESGGGSSGS